MDGYLGFIEFFVVAMFAMAWGILELVCRRLDRKKEAERAKQQNETRAVLSRRVLPPSPRHPEWQHRLYDRPPEAIQRQAFVHQGHRLAEQFGRDHRARIERRVFQGLDDARGVRCGRCGRRASPCGSGPPWRRLERLHASVGSKVIARSTRRAVAALRP